MAKYGAREHAKARLKSAFEQLNSVIDRYQELLKSETSDETWATFLEETYNGGWAHIYGALSEVARMLEPVDVSEPTWKKIADGHNELSRQSAAMGPALMDQQQRLTRKKLQPGQKVPFDERKKALWGPGPEETVTRFPFETEARSSGLSLPADTRWVPVALLGHSMGAAGLWLAIDDEGFVRNRVVRKDTPFSVKGLSNATLWFGDPKNFDELIPLEYHCQKKLQDRPDAANIARALGFEVDFTRFHCRLYTQACAHSDLQRVLNSVQEHGSVYYSEAWIWFVFDKLVECGLVMERGSVSGDEAPGWKQVVHRDLKPANIFLDAAAHDWPLYPQPMLADFGLAFETSLEDKMNPVMWAQGAGTIGYGAPEQCSYMDSESKEPVDAFQLLAATNVWGVGAVICTLVYGRFLSEQPTFLPGNKKYAFLKPDDVYHRGYPALTKLVEWCLEFDPADRPTFAQLKMHIDEHFDGPTSLQKYMKEARGGIQPAVWRAPDIGFQMDSYRVGMAFVDLA